mmetsp:Transcript_26820/g.78097  ORF Transcript_26820/g.78097 Transcript_26820/m.78097 type:complete len:212 (+) Transcript_26820:592-1227(+)
MPRSRRPTRTRATPVDCPCRAQSRTRSSTRRRRRACSAGSSPGAVAAAPFRPSRKELHATEGAVEVRRARRRLEDTVTDERVGLFTPDKDGRTHTSCGRAAVIAAKRGTVCGRACPRGSRVAPPHQNIHGRTTTAAPASCKPGHRFRQSVTPSAMPSMTMLTRGSEASLSLIAWIAAVSAVAAGASSTLPPQSVLSTATTPPLRRSARACS